MNLNYLIIIPIILLACGKIILQSRISRSYLNGFTDVILYNTIVFGGMSLLYIFLNGNTPPATLTLIYGILYGVFKAGFQVSYTLALQRGPVSHTVLIVSFDTAITILFGVMYCGETITVLQIFGLICMFLSLLLAVDFGQVKMRTFNIAWFVLTLAAMASSGTANIVMKMHKFELPEADASLLAVSYLSSTVILFLYYLFRRKTQKQQRTVPLGPKAISMMLAVSVILGVYYVLYMKGVGTIPTAVFFPIIHLGPTILISLFSIFVLKDKVTRQQLLSLLFGIITTLLLCI